MKSVAIILITTITLASCKMNDTKTSQDRQNKILGDTANFTSITWLDSTFHDMGKIKEGEVIDVAFRFKNSGNKNLVITDVSASCGCTVPEKPSEPYAPGQEGVIRAKFNSANKQGVNNKNIFVTANTNPNYQELTFRVQVTN